MPDQNFDKIQKFVKGQGPTVTGTISREYDPMEMQIGLVQVNDSDGGDFGLTAGAYGMGLPKLAPEENGPTKWQMNLQLDTEKRWFHEGEAFGFVLVRLVGGGFTGWIDKVMLKASDD